MKVRKLKLLRKSQYKRSFSLPKPRVIWKCLDLSTKGGIGRIYSEDIGPKCIDLDFNDWRLN